MTTGLLTIPADQYHADQLDDDRPSLSASLAAKFWRRVEVGGADDCWLWRGAILSDGYGSFSPAHHFTVRAHRFSLEIALRRPIPPGLCALHSCDSPACVNPSHLRVGTRADNMQDCLARGRHPNSNRTHCRHGHLYDGTNTYRRRDGSRRCRTCDRLAAQERAA